jgi:hypothetical protein
LVEHLNPNGDGSSRYLGLSEHFFFKVAETNFGFGRWARLVAKYLQLGRNAHEWTHRTLFFKVAEMDFGFGRGVACCKSFATGLMGVSGAHAYK